MINRFVSRKLTGRKGDVIYSNTERISNQENCTEQKCPSEMKEKRQLSQTNKS